MRFTQRNTEIYSYVDLIKANKKFKVKPWSPKPI